MDPTAVIIRAATPADLPALGRLAVHLMQTHHDFDRARFMAVTAQTERGYASYLGSRLGQSNTVVLVALYDGQICGYAWGSLEGVDYMALRGPAGALHDLVVDSGSRGRGVGGLLLQAAMAALEQIGATQVVLSTAARNESAQRLFARHGFRPTMIELTRDL
ncbi:N-acetyltransferase family protein [Gemmatimonas sp.]|uniref:GNAT family N-acetyltransferase n=1 Tax=Gemmatimonas sp. TaxID=1962908 RepID=UPI0035665462